MLNPWQEFISNVSHALSRTHTLSQTPSHTLTRSVPLQPPQGSVNNSLCFLGPHRIYSAWSSTFFELSPGQGHFGPDAIPGDVCALPSLLTAPPCSSLLSHPLFTPRLLTPFAGPLAPWRVGFPGSGSELHGLPRGCGKSKPPFLQFVVLLSCILCSTLTRLPLACLFSVSQAHSQMAFQKRN